MIPLPPIAVIFLTSRCNMVCRFCATDNSVSSMTFEEALALLLFLKKEKVSCVVFGGGEPFVWKHDFLLITQKAKEMGFVVQVGTNGISMPDGFENIDSIDRYVLPIDSMDAAIHNHLRNYPKKEHLSIILERLEKLRGTGRSVTISTVVNRTNLENLPEIANFLHNYNHDGGLVHAWHLYRFIPEGRGGRLSAGQLAIDLEIYHQVCDELKRKNPHLVIYKRPNMYSSKTVDFYWYSKHKLMVGSQPFGRPVRSNLSEPMAIERSLLSELL
ncbi:MAG TPA: hypothetical protein DDW49_07145 [Deltaproteobacteria bacterium]|nr:MAG: hypothetical protein A2048_03605 [Deltaproteobacteria bacterium GWA2_45_12]HBF13146.1 hypothetical protein [Deltaproteobacteria bacterium]